MSDGLKPLIFLEPLSETLKKLKEVFDANADSEGVEVYEVDELEEAAQLIPNLGQALILTASPKKCAMMLQQNRKPIKSLQTKTILLSAKAIPRKTLDKFMKVGLTECVIEPVNPKTLLYKIRLQLRSIKTAQEEESEMNQKFGEGSGKTVEGPAKKVRSAKEEEEHIEEEGVAKKKGEEVVLEDYSKPVKRNYEEESIDNYYKGKQKKSQGEEFEEDEAKERKRYQEEAIDGHYKGKVAQSLDLEMEEEDEDLPSVEELEEDIEAIKQKVNLEVEEDLAAKTKKEVEVFEEEEKKKKKMASISIEEDEHKDSLEREDAADLGGHYKGKVGKKLTIEDEVEYKDMVDEDIEEASSEKKTKLKLEVDAEEPDYVEKVEVDTEKHAAKAKSKKLVLEEEEEEEDEDLIQKLEIEADEGSIPSIERDEIEVEELKSPKKEKLSVLDDESKDRLDKNKADEIDGHLRGGAAKRVAIEDDGEDLYKREEDEVSTSHGRKGRVGLSIEEEITDDDELSQQEQESEKDLYKKKEKLSLIDDSIDEGYKKNSEDEEESEKDLLSKKSLDVEDDELKRKRLAQKEVLNDSRNRSDARADHIKTHYSSKESTKHGDDDWDAKWDKKRKLEDDFPKEKREDKSITLEKVDLGEQTIDYAQLKKEFEGGSYEGIRNKKKVYGEFHEVAEIKTYTKTVLGLEGSPELMAFEEITKEQKDGLEGAKVFEPESLGIEIAIEVQGYYLEDDVDSYKICEFIQERICSEYAGDLVVYQNSKSNEVKQFFNGRVAKQITRAPVKLTEADFEGLSRSERKELEHDYEEDLKVFELKKREVDAGFNQSWGTKLEQWKAFKTPAFRDHTFQELQNEFVFPFYEGQTLLGLAVFIPTTKFNTERAESLEVVFEVLRGLLLTEYHQLRSAVVANQNLNGNQAQAEPVESKDKKSTGFFGKLFGKKAG